MHWDDSKKISLNYVLIYRLKIKYKLIVISEYYQKVNDTFWVELNYCQNKTLNIRFILITSPGR